MFSTDVFRPVIALCELALLTWSIALLPSLRTVHNGIDCAAIESISAAHLYAFGFLACIVYGDCTCIDSEVAIYLDTHAVVWVGCIFRNCTLCAFGIDGDSCWSICLTDGHVGIGLHAARAIADRIYDECAACDVDIAFCLQALGILGIGELDVYRASLDDYATCILTLSST